MGCLIAYYEAGLQIRELAIAELIKDHPHHVTAKKINETKEQTDDKKVDRQISKTDNESEK